MRLLVNFLLGALFGCGLEVSGMTQPSKVRGFLDFGGNWDPSLAFVMAGAISAGLLGFYFASQRERALLGDPLPRSPSQAIDAPLLVGAAIFGVGWGLSGVCPGPAIVNLGLFEPHTAVFVTAMVVGMALERYVGDLCPSEDQLARANDV